MIAGRLIAGRLIAGGRGGLVTGGLAAAAIVGLAVSSVNGSSADARPTQPAGTQMLAAAGAKQADPSQPGTDLEVALLERLDALDQRLPTNVDPVIGQTPGETWATFDVDVTGIAATLTTLEGELRQLYADADDAAGPAPDAAEPTPDAAEPTHQAAEPTPDAAEPTHQAAEPTPDAAEPTHQAAEPTPDAAEPTHQAAEPTVTAAVAAVARGWLDIHEATTTLQRWETNDIAFPAATRDDDGVATGADELTGVAQAGFRQFLTGRARHLAGYTALRDLGVALSDEQQRLAARAEAAERFDTEIRPVLGAVLGDVSTSILVTGPRFETSAPGVDARARSVEVRCVDRRGYEQLVPPVDADDVAALAEATPQRADCTDLASADVRSGR